MAKGASGDGDQAAAPAAPATAPVPPSTAVEELPRSIVRRVVKDKLDQLSSAKEGGGEDMSIQKDALSAFAESARIFIHYLSATANDVCTEAKRQTISAEDVLKAVEDIEFPEFIEPLRASLEEFRQKNAEKKSGAKAKESGKKRKSEEAPLETADEAALEEEEIDNGVDAEDRDGATGHE